jgi:hypothetical protein
MAIRIGNEYFPGVLKMPGEPADYGNPLPDIRPSNVRMDCKYCYTDAAETVESHEHLIGHHMQLLCKNCGAGLTAPEPV